MEYQVCCKMNQDKFQRLPCKFKNRRDLLFFFLTTLLNIKCLAINFVTAKIKKLFNL